jgi:hypothetical protein
MAKSTTKASAPATTPPGTQRDTTQPGMRGARFGNAAMQEDIQRSQQRNATTPGGHGPTSAQSTTAAPTVSSGNKVDEHTTTQLRSLMEGADPEVANQTKQLLSHHTTGYLRTINDILTRAGTPLDPLQSMLTDAMRRDTSALTEGGLGAHQAGMMDIRKQVAQLSDPVDRYVAVRALHDTCQALRTNQIKAAEAQAEAINRIGRALQGANELSLTIGDYGTEVLDAAAALSGGALAGYAILGKLGMLVAHITSAAILHIKGYTSLGEFGSTVIMETVKGEVGMVTAALPAAPSPADPSILGDWIQGLFVDPLEEAISTAIEMYQDKAPESIAEAALMEFAKGMVGFTFSEILVLMAKGMNVRDEAVLTALEELGDAAGEHLNSLLKSGGK